MTRTATTRSFNYTGRHRIEEDHLVAQLSKDDESIILSLRTNFDRPPGGSETPLEDLLEDAEMTCVEVYLRGNSERFGPWSRARRTAAAGCRKPSDFASSKPSGKRERKAPTRR